MIVMHLPGVRNDGNRMRFGERSNLARLADASNPIGVELNVVNRFGVDQIAESVNAEFVLASCNGNWRSSPQLGIAMNVIRYDRLLEPAQIKGLKQRKH